MEIHPVVYEVVRGYSQYQNKGNPGHPNPGQPFMEQLLEGLSSPDHTAQVESFATLLQLLRDIAPERNGSEVDSEVSFPNDILLRICNHIFSPPKEDSTQLVDILYAKAMQKYIDFKKIVEQSQSPTVVSRIFDILIQVPFPSSKEIARQVSLVPVNGESILREAHFKSSYSSCWLAISGALPPPKHRKFLAALGRNILPNLNQPQRMAEFLSHAYDSGGLNGVLALDSLFVLIREHNLDFPSFYDRLYALLDADTINSAYRIRLLKFLDIFMSSTMIPAYIVAGIAKRLSRLSLGANSCTILWIVPFVYNLLWRYPACRTLVHKKVDESWVDPFKSDEPSLAKCGALESSLWEINALENHYWSKIAKLPQIFREKFTKPPFDMNEIIDELDNDLELDGATEELGHRWSKRPPVQSYICEALF